LPSVIAALCKTIRAKRPDKSRYQNAIAVHRTRNFLQAGYVAIAAGEKEHGRSALVVVCCAHSWRIYRDVLLATLLINISPPSARSLP